MRFTSCVNAFIVLATWIAVGLFLWGEHQSSLHEHVEVLLVDGGTGNKLTHFRYRTWIITQKSGPDPEWSEWIEQKSDAPLSLTVPQHCRLNIQAQLVSNSILDAGRRYESMLVAPETNHRWTIRIETARDKALPKANRLYLQSEFIDGPHVLSGRVTDEQGNPVTKFGIRVFFQKSYMESYLLEIDDPDGRFNLHCPLPIAGYMVEAEHFALEQYGFTERTQKAMPDTVNLTIPLKRGFRISGRAKLTKAHGRNTTLVLIDVRTESFHFYHNQVIPYEYEPYWNKYALERPKSFPSNFYVYVNRKQLSPTGDFQFENLQKGKYLLLMMYDDQLVTEQPIVVDSADVAIEPIVIPPIGSVQGVVKEWNSWPRVPESSPFESSAINPFKLYELRRMDSNSRKLFRVDHLGQFRLDNVLVGQYSINVHQPEYQSYTEAIPHPFLVSEGQSTEVESEYAPILELEIRNEDEAVKSRNLIFGHHLQAELRNINGVCSVAWLGTEEATQNGPRRTLYGAKNLPSGQYQLYLRDGNESGKLHSQFNFQKNARIETKEVSVHELIFPGPLKLTCTISKNGNVVFQSKFDWSGPRMECMVEGTGSFDVLLEESSHNWALLRDVSFSQFHVDLSGVDYNWNPGGTIELDISSTKFPFEPVRFKLRNEVTGRSYTGDRQNQYWKHEKTTHEGLMPGTWVYELFGRESLVGEELMLSKKIELKAGETILFEGRF